MKRLLFLLALGMIGYAGVRMYPEVRRYLRIKAM
jgi:uncharacterized protein DUF6893